MDLAQIHEERHIAISAECSRYSLLPKACILQSTYIPICYGTKKTTVSIFVWCCLRIGPRANQLHAYTDLNGISLQWFDEIRYLGVHIIRSSRFKISLDRPKRSFYRVANSIFGRVGRVA